MADGASSGPALRRKLVVLGFRGIGKTTLVTQFVDGRFVERYTPTIEGTFQKKVTISRAAFDVTVLDPAGMVRALGRVGTGVRLAAEVTASKGDGVRQ